jgi:hypothetical protein
LMRWLRLPARAQVEVGVGCLVPLACLAAGCAWVLRR